MLPRRVMDRPGWPPQPGGATKPGSTFPVSTDEVTIERVLTYATNMLLFSCKFNGDSVLYHFPQLDEKDATKVGAILHAHAGQSLTSVAYIPVDEDEE
jgi:hypothetical protein